MTPIGVLEHGTIASRVEELSGHHHLLLLVGVGVGSLALVHQVEQVGLVGGGVLVANSARCSDSVVANA